LLGVALAALMRLPAERRAELKLDAESRIARSGETKERKYKLSECLGAYFPLDDSETAEYERLKQSERGREVREMAVGWIEQGREQERRESLQKQLAKKFGPLNEKVLTKLRELSMGQMEQMQLALLDASSLQELGLCDD
jgi:ATPase subunit of ABC transporter with duplicated ATPase domains